ncbi:RING finger protein 10-like isoform X2 [Clupea harengus]|uniref:RING finger protein 10-like isoform X2 n=1 Tax=Clupea harengus TaxID=7950 RepID=A0A8M1KLM1_CLUHA|nr:RING finger protein 10-like isoform X2 [Clupea harengus]
MEENRKQGKYPEVHIGLENLQQFPAFGSPPNSDSCPPAHPEFLLVPSSPLSSSPASDGLMFPSLGGHSPVLSVGSMEEDSHCMSFAKMLRDGRARADAGPKITPMKDMLLAPPVADSDGESDGSDRVPVPSFQNSFSQAFEKALMQLDHGPPATPQPAPMPGVSVCVCVCVCVCAHVSVCECMRASHIKCALFFVYHNPTDFSPLSLQFV